MDEPRVGLEPIALAQDQVETEPARGYWTGSGKAVWAAVLGALIGVAGAGIVVAVFTRNDLSRVPLWRFVFLVGPILVAGTFLVGSVLLLCRRPAGKVMLLGATVLTMVVMLEESIRDGEFSREPRAFTEFTLLLLGIIALAASKSTRHWLSRPRSSEGQ
ncbi:hypothetical protein [Nocardia sp. NPDC004722]